MKIYIDAEFRCHISDPEGIFCEVEVSENAERFFFNKCPSFIEGYRLKPAGETWISDDGRVFSGGEMITPWKPYNEFAAAQAQYEADLAEAAAAYQEGVNSAYDQ